MAFYQFHLPRMLNCLLLLLLIIGLLTPLTGGQAAPESQISSPEGQARALLNTLSPEERVGQLFLVTFVGTKVTSDTQIYDLIVNHYIGGVILQQANDNFSNGDNSLESILELNRALQLNRWDALQPGTPNPANGDNSSSSYIPLFIGISQEGDGYPNDQILSNLTPLPDEMALGATWNQELTAKVGNVLGSELSALGFNLLLGPSLDVLERPRPEDPSDLGTRTFGGDPFWVGQEGQAFITGVHQGSNHRIAVVAKYFPGIGGADRVLEEEVATIRKSLEQLKKFDLAPFFAVTGNAPTPDATTDALLVANTRYQGFQENMRATTRPISLDKSAFDQLMSLDPLAAWKKNGGVTISDNLGSKAIRSFYELTGQTYDAWSVVRNAFLAGNDLLYLGDVTSGSDPDSYTTTVKMLDLFAQKYREDPTFAEQVDSSVLRILTMKFRLFSKFSVDSVVPSPDKLGDIGKSNQVMFDVARQAATLISPSTTDLNDAIPDPPTINDRIVFISDARSARQCSTCPLQPVFDVNAMQQAVMRLYGPQGSGQVLPSGLSSYSFDDLEKMLDDQQNPTPIEAALKRAHWIVFAALNDTSMIPSSQALRRFLTERPDLFQHKRLVVFAFNAPYYLDATDISKITAFFGLYSKTPSFIDVAARLLFRELNSQGALPVSVPGVGYDLITATSPDPNQIIPLQFDLPLPEPPVTTASPSENPAPDFRLGDLIPVSTGVIYDHNGHPVPDGTTVQFVMTINGVPNSVMQNETTTGGVAHTKISGTSSGTWEVRVVSDPAGQSDVLHFDIPSETGEIVTITPTLIPTATSTPTPTLTPAPLVSSTPMPPPRPRPSLTDWFMAILLTAIVGISAYRLSTVIGQVRWGVRVGFLALIGGLLSYSYLAIGMPGSTQVLEKLGAWAVVLFTLVGCLIGVVATLGWRAVVSTTNHVGSET